MSLILDKPKDYTSSSYPIACSKLGNGNIKYYKVVTMHDYNDKLLFYNGNYPDNLIYRLEQARKHRERLRFYWGNQQTGKDYGDHYDIRGYIGVTTGELKIPILVYNSRSTGGGAICCGIVKLETSTGIGLWQHDNYHRGLEN